MAEQGQGQLITALDEIQKTLKRQLCSNFLMVEQQLSAIRKLITDHCDHNMVPDRIGRDPCGPTLMVCSKCRFMN